MHLTEMQLGPTSTECGRRAFGCTRPAQRSQLHRSACSAHGTLTQAPRGVVPEPGTRATGRVLRSAGHGHRVLSIPVQDRPHGRSDRPYRGSGRPYSESEESRTIPTWHLPALCARKSEPGYSGSSPIGVDGMLLDASVSLAMSVGRLSPTAPPPLLPQ